MIEIIGTAINQWDTGRSVRVTDVEASHVHFANQGDSKAVIMELVDSQALIPDYLLQTGKQLCVYAVLNGVTVESRVFPVKKRERPENYVYEDDQRNYIYEMIQAAEDATAEANRVADELRTARDSGEFTGPQGPQGPQGEPGTALIDDSKVGDAAWSSKNTIDKLCPSFITENDYIVTCEPVEGYPLTVTSAETSSTFTRYGKNLLDLSAGNVKKINYIRGGGAVSSDYWGVELMLPPGTYTIKASLADGATADTVRDYINAQANDLAGNYIKPFANHPVTSGKLSEAQTATFTEWVRLYVYAGFAVAHDVNYPESSAEAMFAKYNVQLEVGNTATAYEPYNSEEFSFTNEDGIAKATVPALPGVNTFINEVDGVTVTGRADPVAIINKLTNAK